MQLNTQLESSEAEVNAQRDELKRAGERLEKERSRANEEREDLLDDHDEELETQKEQYEGMLKDQKEQYEEQVQDLRDRLGRLEKQRAQEDGDWTKELEDALQRERDALQKLGEVRDEKAALKSSLARVEAQQTALQTKLESSSQSIQTATERERQLEDKLDATLSMHSRQLSKRQAREAELERTVADLGAALATARQKERMLSSSGAKLGSSRRTGADATASNSGEDQDSAQTVNYKERFETTAEELETVRMQLSLETGRCDALRQELNDISQERTQEASEAQANQRKHDREMADLRLTVTKLEATVRDRQKLSRDLAFATDTGTSRGAADSGGSNIASSELAKAQQQIESLSEQLIRQQTTVQNYKTETLTLKNRLRTANTRAETAETALTNATQTVYDANSSSGGGGSSAAVYGTPLQRRRFKGGRSKAAAQSNHRVRSIRSALDLGSGSGGEALAETIDAIDSWLVETGGFLRQEPLARLGFFLYLCILHFWSFCLVIFHASSYEEVHGDFGSMQDPSVSAAAAAVSLGPPPGAENLLRHSQQP